MRSYALSLNFRRKLLECFKRDSIKWLSSQSFYGPPRKNQRRKTKLNFSTGFQTQRLVTSVYSNKNGQMALSATNVAMLNNGRAQGIFISACSASTSILLTVGTVMDSSKKPITCWFKAMWWFTSRKSGINAVNLKELSGFGRDHTAWCWLQKSRRCSIRRDREKIFGSLQTPIHDNI